MMSTVMCPNATNLSGTCDERCSSDDQCTIANGQLCCSNGHYCMDPVMNCTFAVSNGYIDNTLLCDHSSSYWYYV